jgi:ABC-type multidrug transport system ATPase subunit
MLSTRGLVKVYPGPVTALNGVDLDVAPGMFGLLGPNGAGKSTFMKILAGLLEPTSGTATLDGTDIVKRPESVWPRLGYLPQEFGFYPHLSGEAMLDHLLVLKGVSAPQGRKKLVAELLDRVNLTFAAKRPVKGYSGGMRQRLGIAQAIAGNPRLLIVDEPTAGLDPEERLRFYHLLSELAADRIVLLSTHIVEDVAVLCPRFAVIRSGRLIALTTPSEARASIAGRMFEGLVSVDDLPRLRTDRMVTQALLVEGRNRARVYEPTGRAPAGFAPAPVTLEDAYLVLMRLGALPEIDESMPSAAIPAGVPAAIHPEATPSYEAPR